MRKIFISCSSKDGKAGLTICNAIEARGHVCWISGRDVRPGENFQEAIVNAISNSGLMVLVFSANANNSDEIKKEIALASQSKIAVIPVRIEDVLPSAALRYEFATRQWIDVFNDWEQAIEQLGQQIDSTLPRPEALTDPARQTSKGASAPAPAIQPSYVQMPREGDNTTGNKPFFARKSLAYAIGGAALLIAAIAGASLSGHVDSKTQIPAQPQASSMPVKQQVSAARTAPGTDPMELAMWNSVGSSNDAAQLNAYLQKYPKGNFADVARDKIAALQSSKPLAAPPQTKQGGLPSQARNSPQGNLQSSPAHGEERTAGPKTSQAAQQQPPNSTIANESNGTPNAPASPQQTSVRSVETIPTVSGNSQQVASAASLQPPAPSQNNKSSPEAATSAPENIGAAASPFAGRWLVKAKDSLGTNTFSSIWELSIDGTQVHIKGEWGPMSFKSGRIDGNSVTLDWSGMWVGGAGGTFEGKLVNDKRIEGRWHTALIFANDWWAEKL